MAAAIKRAMVTAIRVAGKEMGNGVGGKSNGNGDKVGRQVTASRGVVHAWVGHWITSLTLP